MFRRAHPNAAISIQQDADAVPKDGAYYLLDGDTVIGRYRSLKKAVDAYNAILAERGVDLAPPDPPQQPSLPAPAPSSEFYVYGKFGKRRTRTRTFG